MSDTDKDAITIHDRSGRRQFIRRGAAFVAVGAVAASTQPVYADDCDRNPEAGKNAQAPGSDSDSGEGSDPTGCGRQPPPKISQNSKPEDTNSNVHVKKIIA